MAYRQVHCWMKMESIINDQENWETTWTHVRLHILTTYTVYCIEYGITQTKILLEIM